MSNSAPQPQAFGKEAIGTTTPVLLSFSPEEEILKVVDMGGQQFSISQKLDSPPKARPTSPSSGGEGVRICWEPPPKRSGRKAPAPHAVSHPRRHPLRQRRARAAASSGELRAKRLRLSYA